MVLLKLDVYEELENKFLIDTWLWADMQNGLCPVVEKYCIFNCIHAIHIRINCSMFVLIFVLWFGLLLVWADIFLYTYICFMEVWFPVGQKDSCSFLLIIFIFLLILQYLECEPNKQEVHTTCWHSCWEHWTNAKNHSVSYLLNLHTFYCMINVVQKKAQWFFLHFSKVPYC